MTITARERADRVIKGVAGLTKEQAAALQTEIETEIIAAEIEEKRRNFSTKSRKK